MRGLEGKIIGNCELIKEIGSGNFGTVYHGKHKGLRRDVAVKIIKQELVDEPLYLELFQAEAPKMAECDDYTHIVEVYDAGVETIGTAQCCYIVMELMEDNLERRINAQPEWLTLDRTEGIMDNICKGVQTIHDNGLLHQDIKLANIMTKKGRIKIGDFGLAMKRYPKNNEDCVAGGTPGYMAPELENSGEPTIRSDIYSLGAVFQKMVSHLKGVPQRWRQVISKATARDPFERYSSAIRMLNDIEGNESEPEDDEDGIKGDKRKQRFVLPFAIAMICGLLFGTVYWREDISQGIGELFRTPEQKVTLLKEEARGHISRKEYEQAIKLLQEKPNPELQTLLSEAKTGLLKETSGLEPEIALTKLKKAARLFIPPDAEVHYQIALTYSHLENLEAALPEAEKAYKLNEKNETYRNLLETIKHGLYQDD